MDCISYLQTDYIQGAQPHLATLQEMSSSIISKKEKEKDEQQENKNKRKKRLRIRDCDIRERMTMMQKGKKDQ